MSRSRRHTPIFGGGDSAKDDKRLAWGAERTRERTTLAAERWDDLNVPLCRSFEWDGSKEGRRYRSPRLIRCYCRLHWECQYCRGGGYAAWHHRMMRK